LGHHPDQVLGQGSPLAVTADIGDGISENDCIRLAVIDAARGVWADDNGGVVIENDRSVGQSLGCCGIDIPADDFLDERFLVEGFLRSGARDELVVENAAKGCCVVLVLGSSPFLSRSRTCCLSPMADGEAVAGCAAREGPANANRSGAKKKSPSAFPVRPGIQGGYFGLQRQHRPGKEGALRAKDCIFSTTLVGARRLFRHSKMGTEGKRGYDRPFSSAGKAP
jgi:hypothetical protein